jgi:hypothetical protein
MVPDTIAAPFLPFGPQPEGEFGASLQARARSGISSRRLDGSETSPSRGSTWLPGPVGNGQNQTFCAIPNASERRARCADRQRAATNLGFDAGRRLGRLPRQSLKKKPAGP